MEWSLTKLGSVLEYEQPTKYIVSSTEYKDSYTTPVLTAGQSFILGYTDETNNIFSNVPVIIFDDFTTAIKYVDFPFKVKSSALKILKNDNKVSDIRFMFYLLKTLKTDSERHKRYWISTYSELEILLPPLVTQKKIAAILDAAHSYKQNTKALIDKYDALTQSLFLDMFGDPVTNPKGWEWKKLIMISKQITDGTHHSPKQVKKGFPYVTAKHIKEMSLEFNSKPTFVDQEAHEEIYTRCKPEFNDVFLVKDGATTGVACLNSFNEPISLLSSVGLIKPNKQLLNSTFLVFWFNHSGVKKQLIRKFMAGAAIKRYTISKMKKFELIVPPIDLQNQFAERVQAIEAQKEQAHQSLQQADNLFNSLLQKAFKGELV